MASNQTIKIHAPAKINLTLQVTGKREDGYHLLHSLVYFSDFGDNVTIASHQGFKFTIDSDFADAPTDNSNLVIRTAQKLSTYYKLPLDCHIHLNKVIPMGAGLGGGSTDASATAKALLKFWNITPDKDELSALLLTLGADVPVCYYAQSCFFEGIGDIITLIENAPNLHAVLVYPNEHSSTPEIFKNFDQSFSSTQKLSQNNDLLEFIKKGSNDLTAAAIKTTPSIEQVLKQITLTEGSALSRMSGSGSCCFGLYQTEKSAQAAAKKIQKERPKWWIRPVLLKGSD